LEFKPFFVSDELAHYATVLREFFHTRLAVPHTGKCGRPSLPKVVIDPELNYGTVKKTRKQGRIVKVERSIVYGTIEGATACMKKSGSKSINTSFVERMNLNCRTWDAHFSRKSPNFAKNIRYLKAKMAICVAKFNLWKPHMTLTKLANNQPTTPAMAAGLTDHVWTIKEVLSKSFC
jgi:hypothetical protein